MKIYKLINLALALVIAQILSTAFAEPPQSAPTQDASKPSAVTETELDFKPVCKVPFESSPEKNGEKLSPMPPRAKPNSSWGRPEYPAAARKAGEQGTVYVTILITELGLVDKARIKQSSGSPRLDEAALKSMRGWLFEPATEDGKPVCVWLTLPRIYSIPSTVK